MTMNIIRVCAYYAAKVFGMCLPLFVNFLI